MPIVAYAGAYDQRVRICREPSDATVFTDGQVDPTAQDTWFERWASVRPVAGRERFLAQQVQADVTHRIRLRSDSLTRSITPAMWLLLRDGTRLDIKRATDVEMRNTEIELECNQRI